MRGPVILGVMDVKHADRDNLRTPTAMIDTPVQRAESAISRLTLQRHRDHA
jgi:hypothetical protein